MKNYLYLRPLILCGLLWCVLIAVVLLTRPLLTTIETRAMTVAWEMHVRDAFMVPSLNFKPYTQKPPLLAWLINGGWLIFGAKRFVGTLIVSLLSFGCVVWIFKLASRLWPNEPLRTRKATWLCFGAVILQIYGTIIFYDFMLTFFVLGCVYMVWQLAATNRTRYVIGLGLCLGLAGLTKGPAVLVQVLPLALLAPLWRDPASLTKNLTTWYLKILGAVIIGCAIGFGWAVPAALQGGHDYAKWILLQQTTKRVVKAFNHEQPWWFYFSVLPALLLPWLFLPSMWKNLRTLTRWSAFDAPTRFLICWIIPVFVIFSLISGKQLHYILPLWGAFSLLLVTLLPSTFNKSDYLIGFAPFFIFGMMWSAVVVLHGSAHLHVPSMWEDMLLSYTGLPFGYIISLLLIFYLGWRKSALIPSLSLVVWLTVIFIHISAAPAGFDRFSTEPIAQAVREHSNRPVGVVSARYQGDINYLAGVTEALHIIPLQHPDALATFFKTYPNAVVLEQVRDATELKPYHVLFIQPARQRRFYALIEK